MEFLWQGMTLRFRGTLSLSLNLVAGLLLVNSQGTLTFIFVRENVRYLSNNNNSVSSSKVAKE